tara:strand:+ start:160 stop:1341 length:1182 start_codon:yes stop_codon:yes gene_type:complete
MDKPVYYVNIENKCMNYKYYNNVNFFISFEQHNKIMDFNKIFILSNLEIYPSVRYNYKNYNLIDYLFNINLDNAYISFKNQNIYDLRPDNIEFFHNYNKTIIKKYPDAIYIQGHINLSGKDARHIKNPYWIVKENDKINYLMYCEPNNICILDRLSYDKIIEYEKEFNNNNKLTFYKHHKSNYICSSDNLYIHQIITGCYGNGKGTSNISVDHIDQNPLNNTYDNLRIASRKQQEQNTNGIKQNTKRERKHNAKDLPEDITQNMLKKYVIYYKECYNKDKDLWREFFKVEKHPKLHKHWIGSKSEKISIKDKLNEANKIVEDLDNNTYQKKERELPINYNFNKAKSHLIYDRKLPDGKRENLKMKLPKNYNLQEQLLLIQNKVRDKYKFLEKI